MHRERKSQNLIGYCPRKVYWKILHCKLWWISTNALTHVDDDDVGHDADDAFEKVDL